MRVEIKLVTPSMAESFLLENKSNRKLNKQQLNMLVRTIKAGNWALTHQGVAMYSDGTLADGQHRLSAIVESGIACKMPVFYGVEKTEKTVMAVDCGKVRSVKDSSAIIGLEVRPIDIALSKILEFGIYKRSIRLTHQESADLCGSHRESLDLIKRLMPTNKPITSKACVKAAILKSIELGAEFTLIQRICTVLNTGEYNGDVMLGAVRLRTKLLSTSGQTGSALNIDTYNMVLNTCVKMSRGENAIRISTAKLF
jgi:hypothetical protein